MKREEFIESLNKLNILVVGLAQSGMAAVRLLTFLGATKITLCERKKIENKDELISLGVNVVEQNDDLFKQHFDLVIKNPGVSPTSPFLKTLRNNGAEVITEIELGYRIAKKQNIAAITGSNGKTTTTTLTYELLHNKYCDKAHFAGNIGRPYCDLILAERLYEEEGHYIAMELSNAQLTDIVYFRADISTILNLSPDHIDFMGGLDNYYLSKMNIYKNMQADDLFLINKDDELLNSYLTKIPCHASQLDYSLFDNKAYACLKDDDIYINNELIIKHDNVHIPGKHNKQNIMVASLMAMHFGVSKQEINEVIDNFNGVEHRIEFVREVNGVYYYNDSKATNTDATITALKAFDNNVILLVGGHEKGLSMDELKKYLKPVKELIGFGEAGKRIAEDLAGKNAHIVNDLSEAVKLADKLAKKGDIVLLSPTTSSFDQYNCFEERGEHFKKLVNSL